MGIRFGRHAFAMLALLGAPAVGQEPERFDLRPHVRWSVGDTITVRTVWRQVNWGNTVAPPEKATEPSGSEMTITWTAVQRCIAVDEEQRITRALVHFSEWSHKDGGEAPDTSLTGTTIEVIGRDAPRTCVARTGMGKVSDRAEQWLRLRIGPKDFEDPDEGCRLALAHPNPVGVGESWSLDHKALRSLLGYGRILDLPAVMSRAHLEKVEVKDGQPIAHVALVVVLPLKYPPVMYPPENMSWISGGVRTCTLSIRMALSDRPAAQWSRFTMAMVGEWFGHAAGASADRRPGPKDGVSWGSDALTIESTVTLGGEIPPPPKPAAPPPPK